MPGDEGADSGEFTLSSDDSPNAQRAQNKPHQEKRPQHQGGQSGADERLKMSILQAEKRFVDLELGIAQIKDTLEKFRDLDSGAISAIGELPDLKRRLEDMEDLVMVESAGIEELKGIMEQVGEKVKSDLEQEMRSQQQTQPATPAQQAAMPADIQGKMAFLDEVHGKMSDLDELKHHMDEMSHEIASMREQMGNMRSAPDQSGNVTVFSTRLDNLKAVVDELIKRKVELDIKIEKLDKTMAFMQTRGNESLPDGLKKEIDTLNRNFSVIDSRIDAMESVSKNLSEELQRVRIATQKFDSFEKASNLAKDLQAKMEEFKFIENEIKRISNRVEGFYENIDQRLDKIREFERIFPQVKQTLDQMREEFSRKIDEGKVSILDRATKDETSEIRDRLSQIESRISETNMRSIQETVNSLRQEVENKVFEAREPMSVINIEMSDLMSRIIALETRLGGLERITQGIGKMRPIVIE